MRVWPRLDRRSRGSRMPGLRRNIRFTVSLRFLPHLRRDRFLPGATRNSGIGGGRVDRIGIGSESVRLLWYKSAARSILVDRVDKAWIATRRTSRSDAKYILVAVGTYVHLARETGEPICASGRVTDAGKASTISVAVPALICVTEEPCSRNRDEINWARTKTPVSLYIYVRR